MAKADKTKSEKHLTKTLSIEILRPFNSEEIETTIQEEKNRREQEAYEEAIAKGLDEKQAKIISREKRSLNSDFYKKLKEQYPEAIFWDDLRKIFKTTQRESAKAYNAAVNKIFSHVIVDGKNTYEKHYKIKKKSKTGKTNLPGHVVEMPVWKGQGTKSLVGGYIYDQVESSLPSYIRSGIQSKIQSNFHITPLRRYESSLPSAKMDKMPIPLTNLQDNVQIDGKWSKLDTPLCPYYRKECNFLCDKIDPIITIPLPVLKEDGSLESSKMQKIKFLLSLKKRRKNVGNAFKNNLELDSGTNVEMWRLINGMYKIANMEIINKKRLQRDNWRVNITIKTPIIESIREKGIVGGIDLGRKNAIVCAVSNSLKRLVINDNELIAFNSRTMKRRRLLTRGLGDRRCGRGKKNKLKHVSELTERNNRRRDDLINRWAKMAAEFFAANCVSQVNMEYLKGLKIADTALGKDTRQNWPFAAMQQAIDFKLKERGIKVKRINPKDTSRTCHNCGAKHEDFSFENRQKKKFPSFICENEKCGVSCDADYNAARNIAKSTAYVKEDQEEAT